MVRLLEYQGKSLLRAVGLSTPAGEIATTPQGARVAAERLGMPVVVKAQVTVTGRFKAGGIAFAGTPEQAESAAGQILGSSIKGLTVEKVLVEEQLDVEREFYAGVIVDDSYKSKSPIIMFSPRGGVDIEQVAAENPAEVLRIPVNVLDELNSKTTIGLIQKFCPSDAAKSLNQIVLGVYEVFRKYDARSVEVNPIALTSEGNAYCADCRIILDEAAASNHPEIELEFQRDIGRPPTDLEKKAWKIEEDDFRGIAYFVQMTREIAAGERCVGFHGIGGGGAMLGADALVRHGLKLANYADTSGNPTASKVYRIVRTVFSQPNIAGYVLMGAVVANQEQWHHAHALVRALREELMNRPNFPVVILIAGNKERESIEILKHGLEGLPARIEIYGRDYVYNVDYVAERVKTLVDEYLASSKKK
jgi:succinyl-CoA synthetase beta subunit